MGHERSDCMTVITVVVGVIPTGFEKYIAAIGIEMRVQSAQKSALLGAARILRVVLRH